MKGSINLLPGVRLQGVCLWEQNIVQSRKALLIFFFKLWHWLSHLKWKEFQNLVVFPPAMRKEMLIFASSSCWKTEKDVHRFFYCKYFFTQSWKTNWKWLSSLLGRLSLLPCASWTGRLRMPADRQVTTAGTGGTEGYHYQEPWRPDCCMPEFTCTLRVPI